MKTLWNASDRDTLQRRFASLTDDRPALWGKMRCAAMVRHVTWAIQMATGERPVRSRKLPLRFFPIKQLILYVLPFPKSAPTAPSLVVTESSSVAAEVQELTRAVAVFTAMQPQAEWLPHPAFGAMTGAAWGKLAWKHADHHLRQFGA